MNNLDKLTEATMLALQGKLVENKQVKVEKKSNKVENKTLLEKENPANREINAKIRNAYDNIDDIVATGLYVTVYVDTSKSSNDEAGKIYDTLEDYNVSYTNSGDLMVNVSTQEQYNEIMNILKDVQNTVSLVIGGDDYESGAKYNVEMSMMWDNENTYDVNKDTDIYNFLYIRDSRMYDEVGDETEYDYNYGKNAKYSEDTLKDNTVRLRQQVSRDLDKYKSNKQVQKDISKELDTLQKTNKPSENGGPFVNDKEIIDKTNDLKNANDTVKKLSKDDGSFDVDKSRQEFKRYGFKTV